MNIPTKEECYKILENYGTPPHVIAHCEAVANTAITVAKALNEKGHDLNLALIEAAGLLHDVARVEDDHHIVGGKHIEKLGYPEVADIITSHMYHPIEHDAKHVDEKDLVCLGDRLCKFDKYVGYDERMDYIKSKSNYDPVMVAKIDKGRPVMMKFLDGLTSEIGMSVDELMGLNE